MSKRILLRLSAPFPPVSTSQVEAMNAIRAANDIPLAAVVLEELKKSGFPTKRLDEAQFFISAFFARIASSDVELHTPAEWAAVIAGLIDFMQQRQPGRASVRIVGAGHAARSAIEIVTDDMPFLVDTVSMVLAATLADPCRDPPGGEGQPRREWPAAAHWRRARQSRIGDAFRSGQCRERRRTGTAQGADRSRARRRSRRGARLGGDARQGVGDRRRPAPAQTAARCCLGRRSWRVPALACGRQLHFPRLPRIRSHPGRRGRSAALEGRFGPGHPAQERALGCAAFAAHAGGQRAAAVRLHRCHHPDQDQCAFAMCIARATWITSAC